MRLAASMAACACALPLLLASAPARADVWGYVDAQGVAHFATERLDARYELYFRGGTSFDTSQGLPLPQAAPADTSSVQEPTRASSRLLAFFESSARLRQVQQHLRDAARTHGVDFELIKAVIAAESGFDPNAVSPKGAIGLMQVLPTTAQRWGLLGDARLPLERKLTDPRTNVRIGTRYLRFLVDMFPGRLELALAAYNAGEAAVQRAGNRVPPYPETQAYVRTVLQIYQTLKPQQPQPPQPSQAAATQAPRRVHMELPAPPAPAQLARGGALGRGNMPPLAGALPMPALPDAPIEPAGLAQAGGPGALADIPSN